MKATLTFSLPEEKEEFDMASQGADILYAAQNFDNFLRSKLKYEELTEEQDRIYQEVRDKLHECFGECAVWN